jgi:hypothetical protein
MDSGIDIAGRSDRTVAIYARIAGLAYLFAIMYYFFSVTFIWKHVVVPGDNAATVENLINHEMRFRISVAGEIIVLAIVIPLAHALYVILKRVNPNLALLALLFRVGESILGALIAMLAGVVPLLLLKGEAAFGQQHMEALTGLFCQIREEWDVEAIFYGAGSAIFCYLLFKSRCIPRIISACGIIIYLSMLILAPVNIIIPDLPELVSTIILRSLLWFEVIIGVWLLVWGVDLKFLKQQE